MGNIQENKDTRRKQLILSFPQKHAKLFKMVTLNGQLWTGTKGLKWYFKF